MVLNDAKTEEDMRGFCTRAFITSSCHYNTPTCCLGLDVVGCDLHAAVVDGRPPPQRHAPLIVVRDVGL